MNALLAKAKPVKNVAQLKVLLSAAEADDSTEIFVHDGVNEVKVKAVVAKESKSDKKYLIFLKA